MNNIYLFGICNFLLQVMLYKIRVLLTIMNLILVEILQLLCDINAFWPENF